MKLEKINAGSLKNSEVAFEKRIGELVQQVREAIRMALPDSEVESLLAQQDDLNHAHLHGKVDDDHYVQERKTIEKKMHVVVFNSVMEMMACMRRFSYDEQFIVQTGAHENDHMNAAQSLGHEGVYELVFGTIEKDGQQLIVTHPFASTGPAERLALDQHQADRKIILGAPIELSDEDVSALERIRKP